MKMIQKLRSVGGSRFIILPKHFLDFLGVLDDEEVVIEDNEKSKGKFLAIWKKET